MVRRSIAAGAGLLVAILLVLGVRGCLDSRRDAAIVDYVRDVDALMNESDRQGQALFEQLDGGTGGSDVDIENALNSFRIQSAQLVDRADAIDRPGDLDTAQRYLIDTLELRSEGIAAIADNLPSAIAGGDRQEGGAEEIARAMQVFLASDQLYFRRVRPEINAVLEAEGLEQDLVETTFLEQLDWLDPAEVASRIESVSASAANGDAAPGVHGNALGTVTLGGQALVPGGSASVALADDLAFDVEVANQGEHTETDIPVTIAIGGGRDAIEREKVLDTIAPGETKTVTIPLDRPPPTGQSVPVTVEIGLVPGEDPDIDNNSGEFSLIFTS